MNEVYNYQTQEWVEAPDGVMCINSQGQYIWERDHEDDEGLDDVVSYER